MASVLSSGQQFCATNGCHSHLSCTHKNLSTTLSNASMKLFSYKGLRKWGISRSFEVDSMTTVQTNRRNKVSSLVVMASGSDQATATTITIPALKDLPLNGFINSHGRIMPPIEANTEASVFVVMDKNKKVQYIGFSKDLRNTLRLLMGRRPEFCYFYKVFNLPALNQEIMLETRKQWFSELGNPPEGNSDPTQRKFWEQPTDAGSISERGKAAAAKAKARTMIQMLADRGITEEMVYDPKLLEEGKCDILPTKQSQADLDQASSSKEEDSVRTKAVSIKIPSGGVMNYDIMYEMKFKTNGGWMYDIAVTRDDTLTRHRVIVGGYYPKSVSMPEDDFLETIMGFLLYKRIPRHTEGLLDTATFPINYFSISQVGQFFKDLSDWFPSKLPENYWRFMKTEDYGPAIDPPPELGPEIRGPLYE